jgi:hypothetical protein
MPQTLQEAIDYAANPPPPPPLYGIEVYITISMHDEAGMVLVGAAYGLDPMFRPDLPLMHPDVVTFAGPGPTVTLGVQSVPGFSTRAGAGRATLGMIPIDFSVRRDPGTSSVDRVEGVGPNVQIEIETLSPAPPGTVASAFKLEVAEDGALLRAVGPSLQDPASTTATACDI